MSTSIAARIKAKNYNDASLAVAVGCDRSMITRIKLGKATASLPLAVKLGEILDMPPGTFIASTPAAEKASA